MEGGSLVLGGCSSTSSGGGCSKFQFQFHIHNIVPISSQQQSFLSCSSSSTHSCSVNINNWHPRRRIKTHISSESLTPTDATVALKQLKTARSLTEHAHDSDTYTLPRIDRSGRFCHPRAARELALLIVYASCLEGSDPVRLFEKRLNAPRELYYEFDNTSLLEYDHMMFGGPPITTDTIEEADQLLSQFEAESATEAEVLSAPLKLVYSKLLLRFTKNLLSAVVDRWDAHVAVIDKVAPLNWKTEPAGRILEFSILHLAMSEISGLGTRHQIVINEAVDLAKRFCDGTAPRIVNGCLRTFVQDLS